MSDFYKMLDSNPSDKQSQSHTGIFADSINGSMQKSGKGMNGFKGMQRNKKVI
jgi:hypothetical protein